MKVSELIQKLNILQCEVGDVDITVTIWEEYGTKELTINNVDFIRDSTGVHAYIDTI